MLNSLDVMPTYVARFKDGGATATNAFVGTPKVSRRAKYDSMYLTTSSACTTQCCPSRTSLLSGRFAHNLNDNAVGWCGDFISAGRYNETFIKDIKAAGYATMLVGKIVNSMGPMCDKKNPVVPAGFNIAEGDK